MWYVYTYTCMHVSVHVFTSEAALTYARVNYAALCIRSSPHYARMRIAKLQQQIQYDYATAIGSLCHLLCRRSQSFFPSNSHAFELFQVVGVCSFG